MKTLVSLSFVVCMTVVSALSAGERAESSSSVKGLVYKVGRELASYEAPSYGQDLVKSIQPLGIEKFKFEELPKQSKVGGLAAAVTKGKSFSRISTETLRAKKKKKKKALFMSPQAEQLLYINGELCHVANYARSVIYTVLEGPYYGTQTTMTYDGVILYVSYDYDFEETFDGVILYHYYDDSVVITGANQVIKFY